MSNVLWYETFLANWTDIVAVVAVAVAAIVGYTTIHFNRKQNQLNGLMEAFKLLNDENHRKARGDIYSAFKAYQDKNDISVFANKSSVEIVRSDFDQMGSLIKNKTIQKDGFLEAYGETSYRCWNALKAHIEEERIKRNFNHYMENFQWLSDQAVRHWQRKGIDLSTIESY
jgi:hypothetical protein